MDYLLAQEQGTPDDDSANHTIGGPEVRIRQVKPAFWSDAKLASLQHDARLFYIGLWMLADDDGWLRWDVAEMGKDLYGFEGRASRERRIERMAEAIRSMPGTEKLVIHECGHAQLPKLAVHQHLAGTTKRVQTIAVEHSRCASPQIPATPRDSPPRIGKVGIGKVSNGSVGEGLRERAQEDDGFKETPEEKRRRLNAILQDPDKTPAIKEAAVLELGRVH